MYFTYSIYIILSFDWKVWHGHDWQLKTNENDGKTMQQYELFEWRLSAHSWETLFVRTISVWQLQIMQQNVNNEKKEHNLSFSILVWMTWLFANVDSLSLQSGINLKVGVI